MLMINVQEELERRGYVELPRHADVTVKDLIELLQQFEPDRVVCGQNFSHNTADLYCIAPSARMIEDDGPPRRQEILHLSF